MRIRGKRQIQSVPGQSTRPTTARVREAVFNIWQFEIANCRWLDLCAGTGAMGAEALTRQASLVTGIELSGRACTIIERNWRAIAQPSQSFQVLRGDVRRLLPSLQGQVYDRIYFDPPYASDLYEPVLDAIATFHLLAPDGVLAVEHTPKNRLPTQLQGLSQTDSRQYGNTQLTFYRES